MLREGLTGDETCWSGDGRQIDWQEVDQQLVRIAKQRGALDAEEAKWLREAVRGEIWRPLGNATLLEYLEERLGYGPKAASDRVRVALALEELPELDEALATGELPFSAVRELARVATATTQGAWRDHARGKNVRQIEQAVSGRERGDLPSAPPRPELVMHTLRLEVRPETFARFRQVQQVLEGEQGMHLDDDAIVAALCEAALAPAGRRGPKRAAQQILTIECERCGQGWQEGAGERVAIDKAALERAHCDAERIDPKTGKITQDIPEPIRRLVFRRDGRRCTVPGCRSRRHLAVHHITPRYANGGHEVENLTVLCGGHHRALHDGLLSITGRAPKLTYAWTRAAHESDSVSAAMESSPARTQPADVQPRSGGPELALADLSRPCPPASDTAWSRAMARVSAARSKRIAATPAHVGRTTDAVRDAITALVTMGYKAAEARAAVERALVDAGELPVEDLVPAALKRCPR